MTHKEEEVRAATMKFYDAIDEMVMGKGLEPMKESWHHTSDVTSGHPSGDWAHGWDEVLATWEVFSSFGAPGRGGSKVRSLKIHIHGDIAYTTCVFIAAPAFGADTLNCTNVLQQMDGVWKIIHHHADKSPILEAAMEKMLKEG